MSILAAFESWVALRRYAERFGYSFPPRGDQQFRDSSARFLRAASALSPSDQFRLRERMHEYGCPYAMHLFEAKVLGDLLWWRPSSTPELLLDCPHLRQVVEDAAMIRWDTCKEDFRADGSLRDIYITPATVTDWRALYPLLRVYPGVEYSVDDVVQPPPDSIEEALAVRLSGSPMLRFRVGRALVVFHFFSEEEIECDFVPNEITSQADLDALLAFVRQLGDATRKRVAITPENSRELPFITYDPESGGFEHHEISS